jgi:DNA polymerase-3 subunit alpha
MLQAPARPFVHLHCHSHFSLLDGASSISKLVTRAKQHGMNGLALTDHGNLSGALEFYKKAKDGGINPIIGYEAYIAPGSRFERDASSSKESAYHLTLLAQNRTGFKNLIKMASAAYLEGFYFKPRIDKELLQKHHEGIICLSGCVSSEFSRNILRGSGADKSDLQAGIETAQWFHKLFGDRYFIEVMNNGLDIQRWQLEAAVEVAKKLGLPVVTTSDAHYVDRADAEAQDIMLCINTGKFRTDANRMKMEGSEFYLRPPEEMYAAFPGMEDCVARSQEIADSVCIDLELGKRHFPSFEIPESYTADSYLRELCIKGLKERYEGNEEMLKDGELTQVVMDRLDRELNVISKLGFPNYFLIVWDFVRYAREQNVPATARGSGVGALVAFALYLSHVCPIKYDLLFERFLDLNRKEAPDIDIDFCKDRRVDIIRYVKDKYGESNVAQIGTFGTLAARAAIKDVGRALGMPIDRVNAVTSLVPEELHISLEKAITTSEDLRKLYDSDGEIRELLDLAKKIEGLARNMGTHAAAVVIADKPLTEYVPLCRVSGKNDIITQWAMGDVEAAGLLKMDFLGLRNLTILSKAVDLIEQTTGKKVDPYKFPLDDKPTFDLLCRGETKGIFQLESGGIRDLLQKMKPDHFRDIIATNALYRPGPLEGGMVEDYVAVKHGRKKAEYKHPICEEILAETNGVMVYQEQVMLILNRLGGIELASAYTCIKAISKKKEDIINKNKEQFIAGSVANGMSKSDAEDFFNLIIKFAGYGFNKSHSTAYALIAYMTAYLKHHYPVEFMAALLSGDIQGRNFKTKDALVEHIEDARRMNIEVTPPNVNLSDVDFTVSEGKIHFGLSAIKGCGGSAGEAIATERKKRGPFKSLFDFCERVDSVQCGRSAIETLIKAGAFDWSGANRAQLTAALERAMTAGASALSDRKRGQKSFFSEEAGSAEAKAPVALPNVPEWENRERLRNEKEVLGFYLSSHPLAEHERQLSELTTHRSDSLGNTKDRAEVVVGGMISSIKHSYVKKPRPGSTNTKYAMFDLEDTAGNLRCICWPEDFAKIGHLIVDEAVVVIRGVVDRRGDGEDAVINLIVNDLHELSQMRELATTGVMIAVDLMKHGTDVLPKVREIVRGYNGDKEFQLLLSLGEAGEVRLKSGRFRVSVNDELKTRIDDFLGPGAFRRITAPPKPPAPPKKNGFQRPRS